MTNPVSRIVCVGLLALAVSGLAAPARADVSCSISAAAGKPVPAAPAPGNASQFRIFWGISTQIEELADAAGNETAMADIQEAREHTDGYYVNALLAGPLSYWPERPQQCMLNFKRIGAGDAIELDGETYSFESGGIAGRDKCLAEQKQFLESRGQSGNAAREIQIDALQRVFSNIDLAGEQRRGKAVWGESIIRATDFSYDRGADKVSLQELPTTYCVMNGSGVPLNELMIYQEPGIQTKNDKFLWIPRKNSRGELVYSKQPRLDKIPENTHAFGRLVDSFSAAGVPVGGFRVNMRRWNPNRSPEQVKELLANPKFAGFNFEGGTRLITDEKRYINNYVEGMAWILANTRSDISLLMPGYWSRDMVGNDAEIDSLVPRVRQTLLTLNSKLSTAMKLPEGQNAICSSRLAFIVASYGQPVNVKSLPMRRNGKLAGTVTGQIKLLSDVRKELCGG